MKSFTLITAILYLFAGLSNETATKYNNFISPSSKSYFIQHETKEIFQVKFLTTPRDLAKGFSGIYSEQVEKHQGLFFYFPKTEIRSFWMPDTHFDLKIIYLNSDLEVLHIVERAPHHPGKSEAKSNIYRAPDIMANYVLEIRSDSPLGKDISVGKKFRWIKDYPPGFQQK